MCCTLSRFGYVFLVYYNAALGASEYCVLTFITVQGPMSLRPYYMLVQPDTIQVYLHRQFAFSFDDLENARPVACEDSAR